MDEIQRLAYKDRWVKQLVQTMTTYTEGECESATPLVVSGDDNLIVLKVSYDEWIMLLSSVYTGADFCYPEQSDSVRWIIQRAVECPVDLCALIADKITNCSDIQDAIAGAIATNDNIRRAIDEVPALGAPFGPAQLEAPLAENGCDYDVLFAQITGLVDTLDTNNRDFLEILALTATPAKRLANLIGAIPVIETLPIDDIIAFGAKMYDEIVFNYNAQWIASVRDGYRCDLFCMARDKPDCELTYDDLFNYFNNRLSNAVDVGNIVASMVQYTILGSWSGTTVIDIMMLNQIALWRAAGDWLGIELRTLQAIIALSGNIPDSDWELLCTECPEPPTGDCTDFATATGDWLPSSGATVRAEGFGYWRPDGGAPLEIVLTEWPEPITKVQIFFYRTWADDDDYERYTVTVASYTGANPTVIPTPGNPLISDQELTIEPPEGETWDSLRIQIIAGGFTWPTTPPQYLAVVCINPD